MTTESATARKTSQVELKQDGLENQDGLHAEGELEIEVELEAEFEQALERKQQQQKINQAEWFEICALDEITPNTGVTAMLNGTQIAIFRVGEEQRVYALSQQDPFSQAFVMSRGILGDLQGERVVASPIYKQHFSLATGRCLEDPRYKLSVFPCKIEQGKVWLSPIAQKTYIPGQVAATEKLKLVVIGNGLAGMRCVEDVLEMAPDRYEISVIGAEVGESYNRILLSPVLSGEKSIDEIRLHSAAWYVQHQLQLFSGDPAVKINRQLKQVHTASGRVLHYDRLVLATGSTAYIPKMAGTALQGVMSFRDLNDVQRMLAYSQTKHNAVVIGGGLLGLEVAYGLKQRGMHVTVVQMADRLMNQQLDRRASQLLQQRIEQQGIDVLTDAEAEQLLGVDGQVQQVELKSGQLLAADLVVFAVGIRPNIALAQSAGLRCQRGVLVNDTLQSFDPSIYAVGECIEHRGQTFGVVEPLWGQAFICASHLAAQGRLSFKAVSPATQLKVTGVEVFSVGQIEPSQPFEDIILNDEQRQIYKRIMIQNNKVIGAVLFGDTEDGAWYAELIASQSCIQSIRHKLLFGRDFALKQAS